LELFGSAAVGTFDPATSDLDFLVQYEPSSPRELADRYFGLLFALEDLFGCHVDLVGRSAVRIPYFLRAIDSSRVLVDAARVAQVPVGRAAGVCCCHPWFRSWSQVPAAPARGP